MPDLLARREHTYHGYLKESVASIFVMVDGGFGRIVCVSGTVNRLLRDSRIFTLKQVTNLFRLSGALIVVELDN